MAEQKSEAWKSIERIKNKQEKEKQSQLIKEIENWQSSHPLSLDHILFFLKIRPFGPLASHPLQMVFFQIDKDFPDMRDIIIKTLESKENGGAGIFRNSKLIGNRRDYPISSEANPLNLVILLGRYIYGRAGYEDSKNILQAHYHYACHKAELKQAIDLAAPYLGKRQINSITRVQEDMEKAWLECSNKLTEKIKKFPTEMKVGKRDLTPAQGIFLILRIFFPKASQTVLLQRTCTLCHFFKIEANENTLKTWIQKRRKEQAFPSE